MPHKQQNQITLERVKETLLRALDDRLEEVEALGVFGSLARGHDFGERSDIDVFVIVREKAPAGASDQRWWQRVKQALEPFERDVTVLVYTLASLRSVANWYVLRMASEGSLIYDRADIAGLFGQIVKNAERAGLIEETIDARRVWSLRPEQVGQPLEISLV